MRSLLYRLHGLALLVVVALAALVFGAAGPPQIGGTLTACAAERALFDGHLLNNIGDLEKREACIADLAELHSSSVRLDVSWAAFEPKQGVHDETQAANLDAAVNGLRARGIRVMLTVRGLPPWAQDGSYGRFADAAVPIRADALDDFGRFGEYLASHFSGRVRALECWNEPNLWPFLYPQRTADDPYFAPRLYLRMLKSFYAGVQRGDPDMLVVAGATAPLGTNDRNRTSPQRFARFLKDHGASRYFDVYSHHPYTPGGSAHAEPEAPPTDPSITVGLQNLPMLLRLFPTKPFYLTEYGYNTRYTAIMGITVNQVQQAAYLRRAYAYVKRFKQVKMLTWFLVRDFEPAPPTPPEMGFYTGLRTANGARKLSWFAFAGGNRITISAPSRVRPGKVARIGGKLTNSSIGAVAGRRLVLQSRPRSGGSWRTITGTTTGSTGGYAFSVKPGGSRVYRVVWRGVKISPPRTVFVY